MKLAASGLYLKRPILLYAKKITLNQPPQHPDTTSYQM